MLFKQSSSRKFYCAFLTAILFLLFPVFIFARQEDKPFVLTADGFENTGGIDLGKLRWKYQAGDDLQRAAKDFDDSGWKTITNDEINENPAKALGDWNGRAWFRLRIAVDESVVNQPLAWRMWHWGASEIYLDGRLIRSYGAIEPNNDVEYNPRGVFFPVVFASAGEHTVAVRYSFKTARDLTSGRGRWLTAKQTPGFLLRIKPGNDAAHLLENAVASDRLEYFFIGLLFALALVHLLLFAFYPRANGNLYYSFFVAGLAATILLNRLIGNWHYDAMTYAVMDIARQATQAIAVMFLLAFLYIEFGGGRVSRFFWFLCAVWTACIIALAVNLDLPFPYFISALVLTLGDSIRIVVQALFRKEPGAWNIAAGIGVLFVGVINNIGFERKLIPLPEWMHEVNLYIAILSVPVAVSIYLARSFARTNENLEAQLVKEIEHEKERARLKIIEAENERRAKELEEARLLQLSMLPKKLPKLANLEIAAFMKPATEVGGDYYDFHVSSDGTLTAVIGDATGHGLKAGTVVTAAKSLFNVFAENADIPQIFKDSSRALKAMNLRGMFMAMAMMKIKGGNLAVGIAGMPPLLVFRAATGEVEEIALKALPLGGVANFDYRQIEMNLQPGDCVVAMSDGFPEMFNEAGEMFGFDKAPALLKEVAHAAPQEIVNLFVEIGERWAGARAPDDDVTFIVLKVTAETTGD